MKSEVIEFPTIGALSSVNPPYYDPHQLPNRGEGGRGRGWRGEGGGGIVGHNIGTQINLQDHIEESRICSFRKC